MRYTKSGITVISLNAATALHNIIAGRNLGYTSTMYVKTGSSQYYPMSQPRALNTKLRAVRSDTDYHFLRAPNIGEFAEIMSELSMTFEFKTLRSGETHIIVEADNGSHYSASYMPDTGIIHVLVNTPMTQVKHVRIKFEGGGKYELYIDLLETVIKYMEVH